MYQDYKDLLSAFQSHGVKYLVVGGFAVIYHAQPRFTKDLDLFIKSDAANAKATYAALLTLTHREGIRPDDFTDRNNFFRTLTAFIFFPAFPVSILRRHGKGGLRS